MQQPIDSLNASLGCDIEGTAFIRYLTHPLHRASAQHNLPIRNCLQLRREIKNRARNKTAFVCKRKFSSIIKARKDALADASLAVSSSTNNRKEESLVNFVDGILSERKRKVVSSIKLHRTIERSL